MDSPKAGDRRVSVGRFYWGTTTDGKEHRMEFTFTTPEGFRPSARTAKRARRIVEAMARELCQLPGARGEAASMSVRAVKRAHRKGRTRVHKTQAES